MVSPADMIVLREFWGRLEIRRRACSLAFSNRLGEISKDNLATYGYDDVKGAIETGAASRLLVLDTLVRDKKAHTLLETAKSMNMESTIVSSSHEAGQKLKGLGGVGAFLRYKL